MEFHQLRSLLRNHPASFPRFILPDGQAIPAHFHVTEVGHVAKKFVDCGGTFRERDACVLQTYVGNDLAHRLHAGRFADILDLGARILPSDDLEVEVEWDCCVISQYPIASVRAIADRLDFQLAARHTECLAKKEGSYESKAGAGRPRCC